MAGILRATRENCTVQGKISLRGLARLIELSKQKPNPKIARIIPFNGDVDIENPDHLKTDYFTEAWLDVEVIVQDPTTNMTFDQANKVATIDKTVNVF